MNLTWKSELILEAMPDFDEAPESSSQIAKKIPELSVYQVSMEISYRLENAYVDVVPVERKNRPDFKTFRKRFKT